MADVGAPLSSSDVMADSLRLEIWADEQRLAVF